MTRDEIKKLVEMDDIQYEEHHGPFPFFHGTITEVWIWDKSEQEYNTRFIFKDDNKHPEVFSGFEGLVEFLNKQKVEKEKHQMQLDTEKIKQKLQLEADREKHRMKWETLKNGTAIGTFSFVLIALVYLLITEKGNYFPIFAGVVASGVGYIFGKWIPVK